MRDTRKIRKLILGRTILPVVNRDVILETNQAQQEECNYTSCLSFPIVQRSSPD